MEPDLTQLNLDLTSLTRYGATRDSMIERLHAAGRAWRDRREGSGVLLDVELTLARTMGIHWAQIAEAVGLSSSTLWSRLDRVSRYRLDALLADVNSLGTRPIRSS